MNESEIKALARVLDRVDYYRLLKLDPRADASQLRNAYHDARRRFHPDAYLAQPDDVRDAVDRIARRITEGYLVLRDRTRRTAYDTALGSGHVRYSSEAEETAKVEVAAVRGTTVQGKRFVTLAEEAERAGDLVKMVAHLRTALTLEPKNAALKARVEELEAKLKAAKKKPK